MGVQRERSLVVVDVRLPLDEHEREFALPLGAASQQVLVELIGEELLQAFAPVALSITVSAE